MLANNVSVVNVGSLLDQLTTPPLPLRRDVALHRRQWSIHSFPAECRSRRLNRLREYFTPVFESFWRSLQCAYTCCGHGIAQCSRRPMINQASIEKSDILLFRPRWPWLDTYLATIQQLVLFSLSSGRTSVLGRRALALLRSACSWWVTTYVGKPSGTGQPTRPTQPFILSRSINE